jgi:hypothetical protein
MLPNYDNSAALAAVKMRNPQRRMVHSVISALCGEGR